MSMKLAQFLAILSVSTLLPVLASEQQNLKSSERWKQKHGLPESYCIMYDTGLLSGEYGRRPVRRLETWFYLSQGYKITFDNGYRVSIKVIPKFPIPRTNDDPLQYSYQITRAKLEHQFGKPSQQSRVQFGSRCEYVVDSYNFGNLPYKYTFLNNQLVSAVGGMPSVTPSN